MPRKKFLRQKKSIVVITFLFGGGLIFLSKFFDHPPFGHFVVEAVHNRSLQAVVIFKTGEQSPELAHYTEHLAWLPNIGKDSRPEDRDSNAWTRGGCANLNSWDKWIFRATAG